VKLRDITKTDLARPRKFVNRRHIY
jgi:hypothetical protein